MFIAVVCRTHAQAVNNQKPPENSKIVGANPDSPSEMVHGASTHIIQTDPIIFEFNRHASLDILETNLNSWFKNLSKLNLKLVSFLRSNNNNLTEINEMNISPSAFLRYFQPYVDNFSSLYKSDVHDEVIELNEKILETYPDPYGLIRDGFNRVHFPDLDKVDLVYNTTKLEEYIRPAIEFIISRT